MSEIVDNPFLNPQTKKPAVDSGSSAAVTFAGNKSELDEALRKRSACLPRRLGELLMEERIITEAQLQEALGIQAKHPTTKLGIILEEMGAAKAETVAATLARKFGMPFVRLSQFEPEAHALSKVSADMARRHHVMPLMYHNARLIIAMDDPMDANAIDLIRFAVGGSIETVFATESDIRLAIDRHYGSVDADQALKEFEDYYQDDNDALAEAEKLSKEKPIVRLVDNLFRDALYQRASDIHIQPQEEEVDIMFRVDGVLRKSRSINKNLLAAVVSRIKILGHMDVSERRLPQDGRCRLVIEHKVIDLRISVIPTVKGESIVVRLLNPDNTIKSLDKIGMSLKELDQFRDIINRSAGVILVTGPTGSGKSTTLNSVIQEIRQRRVKIITVEDPVEYHTPDIDQIQVNNATGFTFPNALRHILRHDPEVIMIGEIRDRETAQIAIESALTGHLVFSTLHTNSAAATIARLVDMGIEPYLISTSLLGVLAQRLIRRNCPVCMTQEKIDPYVRKSLGVGESEVFFKSTGCGSCDFTGYSGRIAVHELLMVSPDLRHAIKPNVTADEIQKHAVAGGMVPLTQNAIALARSKVTSLEEVYRVRLE